MYVHCIRNQLVPITRQSTELTLHKGTFKLLELEQLHVHIMGASFYNQWLTSRREKGLALMVKMNFCSFGSRQMNIDYAVCQSLSSMESNSQVIAIYDVACQWSRHFRQRVKSSKYLDIPSDLTVVPAVGKWHLGAHVVDCFPKFSLNFIRGMGQVDGEILETLWSITNKVSGTTRAMAKSHQSEVLDDNMYDSNWKKWVGIGESILNSFHFLQIINNTVNSSGIEPEVQGGKSQFAHSPICIQRPNQSSW